MSGSNNTSVNHRNGMINAGGGGGTNFTITSPKNIGNNDKRFTCWRPLPLLRQSSTHDLLGSVCRP